MKNPFVRPPEFEIVEMTTADTVECATLHSDRFRRAWSADEIHALLVQKPVYGFVARRTDTAGALGGFVLARMAAAEAEILTIAVRLRHERKALGWRLMRAAIREAHDRGTEEMFLEVDETNAAALGLYRTLGFRKVGERKAYYDAASGKSAALVLRLDLTR
jgi:ribosomal-protein-alanine N-acetyltransferase